jgi:hypothetical protein
MPSLIEVYEKIKVYRDKFGGGLRWNSIVEDIITAYEICFANIQKKIMNEELWDILFNITDSEQKLRVLYDDINHRIFFDKIVWFMVENPHWSWHGWKDITSLFEK